MADPPESDDNTPLTGLTSMGSTPTPVVSGRTSPFGKPSANNKRQRIGLNADTVKEGTIPARSSRRIAALTVSEQSASNGFGSDRNGTSSVSASKDDFADVDDLDGPPIKKLKSSASSPAPRKNGKPIKGKGKSNGNDSVEDDEKRERVVLRDGTVLKTDDHIFMICEPPGEPYWLARIMEFVYLDPSVSTSNLDDDYPISSLNGRPVNALRVNWYYRPRDIHRTNSDPRYLFASFHTGISPISCVRGLISIKHRSAIGNLEEYKKQPNSFWFNKLHDRYMQRTYEMIPMEDVTNAPAHVLDVLRHRWKYVVGEIAKVKELCEQRRACAKCSKWCASTESVRCSICRSDYHMLCLRPPLLKKPSKGFGWTCAPCSRAREKEMRLNEIPDIHRPRGGVDTVLEYTEVDDELLEDEYSEDDIPVPMVTGPSSSTSQAEISQDQHPNGNADFEDQTRNLWPFRYLGIHCNIDDAVDPNDNIYPRAISRIGNNFQTTVIDWPGRPVEYVDPPTKPTKSSGGSMEKLMKENGGMKSDKRNKKSRSTSKQETAGRILTAVGASTVESETRETTIAGAELEETMDSEKNESPAPRPPWIQDRPAGYVVRGEDDWDPQGTDLKFKRPPHVTNELVDSYIAKCKVHAKRIGVDPWNCSFLDACLSALHLSDYNFEEGLNKMSGFERSWLWNPIFTKKQEVMFEEGVKKYGNELSMVWRDTLGKQRDPGEIVRFYYMWKKTSRGMEIWGNFKGRKSNKLAKAAAIEREHFEHEELGDSSDDSAFDEGKAKRLKRFFQCKFCEAQKARMWRRAPQGFGQVTLQGAVGALCDRCGELWRLYGMQWVPPPEEQATSQNALGEKSKSGKRRKADPEESGPESVAEKGELVPRKVANSAAEGNHVLSTSDGKKGTKKISGKAAVDIPETLPNLPPCAVCGKVEARDHVQCGTCGMFVHTECYGYVRDENKRLRGWTCDMCLNEKNPTVSQKYECVLCPNHESHEADFNGDLPSRPPLKKTSGSNWAHVLCAVFIPEVRFGNAPTLAPVEGIGTISPSKWGQTCTVCKSNLGACVSCPICHKFVHVSCALAPPESGGQVKAKDGYIGGMEITPVKGSRRDLMQLVQFGGEYGHMQANVWCGVHDLRKVGVHPLTEIDEITGESALMTYVRNYKQADLNLTGTMRKAQLINNATKTSRRTLNNGKFTQPPPSRPDSLSLTSERNNATVHNPALRPVSRPKESDPDATESEGSSPSRKERIAMFDTRDVSIPPDKVGQWLGKYCAHCGVRFSPIWWPAPAPLTIIHMVESQAYRPHEGHDKERKFWCHKCHWKHNDDEIQVMTKHEAEIAVEKDHQKIIDGKNLIRRSSNQDGREKPQDRGNSAPPHATLPDWGIRGPKNIPSLGRHNSQDAFRSQADDHPKRA